MAVVEQGDMGNRNKFESGSLIETMNKTSLSKSALRACPFFIF